MESSMKFYIHIYHAIATQLKLFFKKNSLITIMLITCSILHFYFMNLEKNSKHLANLNFFTFFKLILYFRLDPAHNTYLF